MSLIKRLLRPIAGRLGGYVGGWQIYEGARQYQKGMSWIPTSTGDQSQAGDRYTRHQLLGIARTLYGNVGFVKGAISDIGRHSVGNGIFPHSAIPDKAIANQYDEWLKRWWEIPEVTYRLSMSEVQCMASEAIDVDGDLGFVLGETPTGWPQIQPIEAHRIEHDGEWDGYMDGVKTNDVNRPVAFGIRIDTADGIRWQKIPASSFVHVFEAERFSGVRGISGLKHGIQNLRDIKDILAYEKKGVKINSAVALVIKQNSIGSIQDGFFSSQTKQDVGTASFTFEQMDGGMIPKLLQGEELNAHAFNRPSTTFVGFIEELRRDIAVGLGVPLEFLWDPSSLGGTAQRFVMKKTEKRFEQRQATIRKMTLRIRNWAISKAVNRGDLPAHDEWWKVHWQGPAKISVDVGREANANREDVASGLRTPQEDFEERGIEFATARNQIESAADDLFERAVRLQKKYEANGMTLQMALDYMERRGNTGSPPSMPATAAKPVSAKEPNQ